MDCPCHSNQTYESCCQPFHENKAFPSTPLLLMRSRYSAYALKMPDYIIETTYEKSPLFDADFKFWKKSIMEFCDSTLFMGLTIFNHQEEKEEGWVTFRAHLFRNHQDVSFIEKSHFIKVDEKWYYDQPEHD